MRVKAELLSNYSGAELAVKKCDISSKKTKRRRRRPGWMPPVIQQLFDSCKAAFAEGKSGFVLFPDEVARIQSILDQMKPADVGISPKLPYFRNVDAGVPPSITYLHVFECPKFSIGLFCLPPSAVIPLHNHPGMTVFSKLLFGSMHIKSYDWVAVGSSSGEASKHVTLSSGERLAKLKTDAIFTAPCETSILYPDSGGNMHCFTARTACAVLDVLVPPYLVPDRNCTYYYDYSYAKCAGESPLDLGEGEGYAWLQERTGEPEELHVVGARYRGPKIAEG